MNSNLNSDTDYLWDKTGEPDPEIQQLEEILGTLRYQPRPLEIPSGLQVGKRSFFRGLRNHAAPLAIAGTGGGTGWAEAVEQTFIIRTAAFGLFKWIMLDVPTDNFFGKVNPADFSSDFTALMSNLTADTSIYAGRDNSKPNIVKQATITLNEKLRRAYKLT